MGQSPVLFCGLPALWWEAGRPHRLLLPALDLVLLIHWAVSHLRVLLPFHTSLSTSLFCKSLLKGFLPSDTLGWVVCPTSALLQNSLLFFPHCLSHTVFMRGSYEFFESRGPCLNYLFPQKQKLTHGRYQRRCVLRQRCMNDGVAFWGGEFPSLEVFHARAKRALLLRSYSVSHFAFYFSWYF